MPHLLVTGGAGFIGSNFVRYILDQRTDYEIINLDLLTYAGNPANLADVENHPRYNFIQGDIADTGLLEPIFAGGIDLVVNLAAESHVDRSIECPGVFVQTNVLGTQVLLDLSRRHGVKKYVQVSTDEVYGALGSTGFFTETTPVNPSSPYSASKASADLIAMSYHRTFGVPVNITRCSNNYGPYQYPEKLIPAMIIRALCNKPLPVYGDGRHVRDWLHVKDHCEAILLVLEHGRSGEIYNIGGNNEQSNLAMVHRLLKLLGKPTSLITFVPDRPGHDRRYAIDATKIREDLDWSPRYNLERGLLETVEWYSANESWWRSLGTEQGKRLP